MHQVNYLFKEIRFRKNIFHSFLGHKSWDWKRGLIYKTTWPIILSIFIIIVHLYYYYGRKMEEWSYFDYNGELKSKRTKICITCSHFRYTTDALCRTLLTCPLHEKLIPQGDHLIKGCQYWKKDVRVFAPEAAWTNSSSQCQDLFLPWFYLRLRQYFHNHNSLQI